MLCPLHFVSAVTLKGKVWGPTKIYLHFRASHCMVSAYFFRISRFWWRKCRNHFQPATLSPLQCDIFFYTCFVPYWILFWMQIVHIPLCPRKGTGERVHKLQRLFADISKWKVKQLGYQSWTKEDRVHPLKEGLLRDCRLADQGYYVQKISADIISIFLFTIKKKYKCKRKSLPMCLIK